MKRPFHILLLSLLCVGLSALKSYGQVAAKPMSMPVLGAGYPWSDGQLIEPSELAATIKSGDSKPVTLNIGAVEDIPGAIHIGAVSSAENMGKLQIIIKALLTSLKRKSITAPQMAMLMSRQLVRLPFPKL